jgi:hypothetical protein
LFQLLEFIGGVIAVLVMTYAFYGWGRMARRLTLLPVGTWPVSTALGMASVIAIGGILNLARGAFPSALGALVVVGLTLAFHANWRDGNPFRKLKLWRAHSYALLWGISALMLTGLAIATQLAPSHYNLSDDFQHFFGHAVRMVETGTLYGSPLNALGGEVLGGQAFLQSFIISFFPLKFINAADAVFCFFVCLALAGGVAFERPILALPALMGSLAVFIIDPQYVNISSLYSTAAMVSAVMILNVDLRERGESIHLHWRQAAAPALFYAGTIALKNTGIVFVGLQLIISVVASLYNRDWRIDLANTAKTAAWTIVFVTPWILLYSPYYLAGFANPIGPAITPVPEVGETQGLLLLLSTAKNFYGAPTLAYTCLAAGLLAWALDAVLRARSEVQSHRKSLIALACVCVAAAGTYLFWMIIGPQLQESFTTLRYAIPVLIGASSAALPLWAAQTGRRAAFAAFILSAPIALLFAAPLHERLSTFYHQRSALAYLRHWGGTTITLTQEFVTSVLENKDPLNLHEFQETVPPGEPLLVWTETSFLLDYQRNKIMDMNVAGMGQAWARISMPKYLLWQSNGDGIATAKDYVYDVTHYGRRSGYLAARALDVYRWLKIVAAEGRIIKSENDVVLLEVLDNASLPLPP